MKRSDPAGKARVRGRLRPAQPTEGATLAPVNVMQNHSSIKQEVQTPVPCDIVFFGVLMILSGIGDLYIIVANPAYSLPLFGTKPHGIFGALIKFIHPLIHFASGYGAIYAKRWAYPLFMAYSVYGLVNAITNRLLLPPPHRIRTLFIVLTVLVMGYLYFRRRLFKN